MGKVYDIRLHCSKCNLLEVVKSDLAKDWKCPLCPQSQILVRIERWTTGVPPKFIGYDWREVEIGKLLQTEKSITDQTRLGDAN